jgi:hypothetical protein
MIPMVFHVTASDPLTPRMTLTMAMASRTAATIAPWIGSSARYPSNTGAPFTDGGDLHEGNVKKKNPTTTVSCRGVLVELIERAVLPDQRPVAGEQRRLRGSLRCCQRRQPG